MFRRFRRRSQDEELRDLLRRVVELQEEQVVLLERRLEALGKQEERLEEIRRSLRTIQNHE